ncbi:lytic transglycosylase domain-containing protein [Mesorhizobium sp. GR13]|uniref:lytic transglycosylase domain-containing protein n=1 Tax=Mesorhizobium sp. GR13 TaxID=2562308 RepID=UPI0010C001B8|nr:lytic transglycosylase domain-containing protein [Mesorhizobium sp. GR13]
MDYRWVAGIGLVAVLGAGAITLAPGKPAEGSLPPETLDRITTAVVAPVEPKQDRLPAQISDTLDQLSNGLSALSSKQIDAAIRTRDELPSSSLDRHILSWAIALYGGSGVPSAEIAATSDQLADWPAADDLRANFERSLLAENPEPESAFKAFASRPPLSVDGAIVLARAQLARGDREAARRALSPFWRSGKMDARDELIVVREFSDILTVEDHRIRMERLLYEGDATAAARVAPLAHAEALNKAWSAVLSGSSNAQKLLDAVPGDQRSPGYSFAKIKLLRKANKLSAAADLMQKAPDDANALIDPSAWWTERRLLARNLYDAGKIKLAYTLVAEHAAQTPQDMADAEFAAGWYALRGLDDPKTAKAHFGRIAALAEGPITRARAYYWLGRATEAASDPDAKRHFEAAARYGTTFYGQLAAAQIGSPALNLSAPTPSEADRARFDKMEAVRAIDRLEAAGQKKYAYRLYLDLAKQLATPGEIALLCARAEQSGNHFVALKVAKAATQRGIEIGALSHPMGVIPDDTDIAGAGMALAYAVARQESEFNTGAVSGAGALGLLQLMPDTAQEMAKKTGLAYSQQRLTVDPAYNATLGAAMLNQQLQRFNGSYILTFAAYNAGPRRVSQWISRYGDPRGKPLDEVVDWIEKIPFSETRAYVQRVLENYEVYKMRLTGHFDIVADLTDGRSGPTVEN